MRQVLMVLLMLAIFPAWAQNDANSRQEWPRHHVGDYTSDAGEALPDFLLRTARVLHDFTRDKGHEVCGAIASDGTRYSVRLYSDGVPHGCAIHTREILDGFTFTGETIHSHPARSLLTLDAKARAWSKFYRDGNHGAPTLRNDGASGFSPADYAGGPGWLVAKGRLLHLSNGKTTRYGAIP